jgi:hypothetical protein
MVERAALGLRVKTGWAAAVVLEQGAGATPVVTSRRRLELTDPKVPSSAQPYHAGLELSGKRAEAAIKKGADAARAAAHRALRALIDEVKPVAIGIVVASDPDLSKIGNDHVRAHAAEGLLFREILEESAARCGVETLTLIEGELWGQAEVALGVREGELKRTVAELGKAVGRPWTALEKNATVAGWLALTG